MRFNFPTPLHGWRAFWGEVGIIVLGVLIALGAQQIVENLGDRQRAARARQAIRAEVAGHDSQLIEISVALPCIAAQIDRIEKRLADGDTSPLPRFKDRSNRGGYVLRIPSRPWPQSAWQSINGIETLRLFDPTYVENMSAYYGQLENVRRFSADAADQMASLNALGAVMPKDDGARLRFLEMLARLRYDMFRLDLNTGQLGERLAASGQRASKTQVDELLAESDTLAFCRRQGLPLGKHG